MKDWWIKPKRTKTWNNISCVWIKGLRILFWRFSHFILSFQLLRKYPGGLLSHVWGFFVGFSTTVWWIFFLGFGFWVVFFFFREEGFYTSCLSGLWVFVDTFRLGLWSTHLPCYSEDRQWVTVTKAPLLAQLILKCSKRTWYFQLHPQEDAKTEKLGYS